MYTPLPWKLKTCFSTGNLNIYSEELCFENFWVIYVCLRPERKVSVGLFAPSAAAAAERPAEKGYAFVQCIPQLLYFILILGSTKGSVPFWHGLLFSSFDFLASNFVKFDKSQLELIWVNHNCKFELDMDHMLIVLMVPFYLRIIFTFKSTLFNFLTKIH